MNLLKEDSESFEIEKTIKMEALGLFIDRALKGQLEIINDYVLLYKKGTKPERMPISIFFDLANILINTCYRYYDALKSKEKNTIQDYKRITYVSYITIITSRMQRYFYCSHPEYNKLVEKTDQKMEEIKADFSEEIYEIFGIAMENQDGIGKGLKQSFDLDGWTEQDVLFTAEKYIGQENFKKNLIYYIGLIINNKSLLQKLEDAGYLEPSQVTQYVNKDSIFRSLKEDRRQYNYILKYLSIEDCIEAFSRDCIDEKSLSKYVSIEDLLRSSLDKSKKMNILRKQVYVKKHYNQIWQQYENGELTLKEVSEISKLGYLNPNTIVEQYIKSSQRKIASELDDTSNISKEKLIEFFNPNQVLELTKKSIKPETFQFFITDLRAIYDEFNRNLERELIEAEKANIEKQKEEKSNTKNSQLENSLINLYKIGLVRLSEFNSSEISENEILNLYKINNNNEQILIEAYNAELISQETILENITNSDHIFNLIKENKLNVNILDGYYGTTELLDLYRSEKITLENLREIKTNIDLEKIKSLYQANELTYSELFELAEYGIIDQESANQINDSYNIEADLEELRKKGGIKGQDIDLIRQNIDPYSDSATTSDQKANSSRKIAKTEHEKIDLDLKQLLFENLGAGEVIKVSSKLFRGYKMIPFIDKKIAILEGEDGEGRTYILPIKVVLEQVRGAFGSEDDILGKAVYRKDLYTDTKHVRTAYHTANWGKKVIEGMVDLRPELDKKELLKQNEYIISEIYETYKKRKSRIK